MSYQETNDAALDRYARQARFTPLGVEGQRRLAAGRALICGCGALGSVIANTLARAGVGFLRIVDRDFVELNNLQRQVLFDERDVAANLPKAVAASEKLRAINSQITIESIVADFEPANARSLADGVDIILDGTDNFETRFLINDLAIESSTPWVYGGCIGAEGQTMTIIPGETACLRCLMSEPPPAGEAPTCDTAGILAPIVGVIASLQSCEAIKILSGVRDSINRSLTVIDIWDNRIRQVGLDSLRAGADCPACRRRELSWLRGERSSRSAVLCGRDAVQISPAEGASLSLDSLAARLATVGQVSRNPYLVRLVVDRYVLTIFADGRAIIGGASDVATARAVYSRYVGM